MIDSTIRLLGVPGSPYSRKLRSVLRYRRIPHVWVLRGSPESVGLPKPRVDLLPQLFRADLDGPLEALVDTTPLIDALEGDFEGRAVRPADAVIRFLDGLVEDYADEWLTKAMFHYRWAYADDIAKAAAILPRWFNTSQSEAEARANGEQFAKRQIDRLWVVGSNEQTGSVIEASYERLLALLDARLLEARFLFGSRPSVSDFAVFGQLTQLVGFDPTPSAVSLEQAPRVVAWVDLVDDLSGMEPEGDGWVGRESLPESLRALLAEIGRVYAPFLIANAEALADGSERVECEIDGQPWVQRPFPYQGKCLMSLRAAHGKLSPEDRADVDALLAGTGCDRLFES